MLTNYELQEMIDAQSWRKTNYIEPHEYFLKPQNPELFEAIAERVKQQPTFREFMGRKYKYYILNGWRYWHFMLVLNRAKES